MRFEWFVLVALLVGGIGCGGGYDPEACNDDLIGKTADDMGEAVGGACGGSGGHDGCVYCRVSLEDDDGCVCDLGAGVITSCTAKDVSGCIYGGG